MTWLILLIACSTGASSEPSPAPPEAPLMPQPITLTETRSHGERQATATIDVTIDGDDARHLAGARAWRTLAGEYEGTEAWADALTCARGGVDELGATYRPPSVRDDTRMKLHAVDEQLAAGRTDNAARTLIGILDARIEMMEAKLGDQLVQ